MLYLCSFLFDCGKEFQFLFMVCFFVCQLMIVEFVVGVYLLLMVCMVLYFEYEFFGVQFECMGGWFCFWIYGVQIYFDEYWVVCFGVLFCDVSMFGKFIVGGLDVGVFLDFICLSKVLSFGNG